MTNFFRNTVAAALICICCASGAHAADTALQNGAERHAIPASSDSIHEAFRKGPTRMPTPPVGIIDLIMIILE